MLQNQKYRQAGFGGTGSICPELAPPRGLLSLIYSPWWFMVSLRQASWFAVSSHLPSWKPTHEHPQLSPGRPQLALQPPDSHSLHCPHFPAPGSGCPGQNCSPSVASLGSAPSPLPKHRIDSKTGSQWSGKDWQLGTLLPTKPRPLTCCTITPMCAPH